MIGSAYLGMPANSPSQYQAKYGELPADEYVSLGALDRLTLAFVKTAADTYAATQYFPMRSD